MSSSSEVSPDIVCAPHPEICVRRIGVEGAAMTIVLDGQIRYQAVAGLQEFLFAQICRVMPESLVLDFQRVSFIDSQGLSFLVSLYKFCHPQRCSLALRQVPPDVETLIRLTRLNAFIKLI
jgi:anti-anti-sigma factor